MITKAEALTGQYSADGSPWVQVAVQAGIDVDTLEYSAAASVVLARSRPDVVVCVVARLLVVMSNLD